MKRARLFLCAFALLLLNALPARSDEFRIGWQGWTQPDGTTFIAQAYGNKFAMDWETLDRWDIREWRRVKTDDWRLGLPLTTHHSQHRKACSMLCGVF
ncbi:MAG: hypothetical protein J7M27_01370 [Candidatus Latescibacteria bacterium]|nr:hypothetical protein [Candidatus Latescibacterota bacterium]